MVPEDIDFEIEKMMEENSDGLDLFKGRVMKEMVAGTKCQAMKARGEGHESITCDESGRFEPTQCINEICFCVDEGGNRVIGSKQFVKGEDFCCK